MNGPFSGKTNLDFTEARDSELQWHQLGRMQVCTSLQTDNHAGTQSLRFLQAGCPSCHPTNTVKALKEKSMEGKKQIGKLSKQANEPNQCQNQQKKFGHITALEPILCKHMKQCKESSTPLNLSRSQSFDGVFFHQLFANRTGS